MPRTLERRAYSLTGGQVRAAASGDGLHFTGEAVVYGQLSDDMGGWRERIDPGAATRTLAANPDVRFLINHDANLLGARTTSGTLRLSEGEGGLPVDADLADTTYNRDLAVLMERGDINQMSFAFWVTADSWAGNIHQVHEFDLDGGDVSVVTFPAFPQTSAELREAAARALGRGEPTGGDLQEIDLTLALRALIEAPAERVGAVLSSSNADLVKQAIDALTALLEKSGRERGYPLDRAKHRLHEFELLATL